MESIYEAAGGGAGWLRLAKVWHQYLVWTTTVTSAPDHKRQKHVPEGPGWSRNGLQANAT